jgi:hypothetical protein
MLSWSLLPDLIAGLLRHGRIGPPSLEKGKISDLIYGLEDRMKRKEPQTRQNALQRELQLCTEPIQSRDVPRSRAVRAVGLTSVQVWHSQVVENKYIHLFPFTFYRLLVDICIVFPIIYVLGHAYKRLYALHGHHHLYMLYNSKLKLCF